MASGRGRGFLSASSDSPNARVLRRPNEAAFMQRYESLSGNRASNTHDVSSEVSDICDKMMKIKLRTNEITKEDLGPLAVRIRALCHSEEDMKKCVESVFSFAMKGKWNAHAYALFCRLVEETIDDGARFRSLLLCELQSVYKVRNTKYPELESFLMEVAFVCEIYYHIRIKGKCINVLAKPVIDYFGMLVDGASQKEVEMFVEHFPRCFYSLKESEPSCLNILLCKLRKQIICQQSVVVRSMLLEMFERSLINLEPLDRDAEGLYKTLSKRIIRLCE